MNMKQKLAAGAAGAAILSVIGASMAVFMDMAVVQTTGIVGTLDLTTDAVFSHANAYAVPGVSDGNISQGANNINPGDNDHTDGDSNDPDNPKRDGTDHELTVHVQNNGNKSMITRSFVVVTGESADGRELDSETLKQIYLYLSSAQNDTEKPAAAVSPAPTEMLTRTPDGEDANPVSYQQWAEDSRFSVQAAGAAGTGVNISESITTNSTVTPAEKEEVLTPGNPDGSASEGQTEKLLNLKDAIAGGRASAAWTNEDYRNLTDSLKINDSSALVYEVHRNMVLSGAENTPGATEFETVAAAKGIACPDLQNYINKSALEGSSGNYVPSSKDFVIEVGMAKEVGDVNADGSAAYASLEGATLHFQVIVQAMQFRNTGDNLWQTMFARSFTTTAAR